MEAGDIGATVRWPGMVVRCPTNHAITGSPQRAGIAPLSVSEAITYLENGVLDGHDEVGSALTPELCL